MVLCYASYAVGTFTLAWATGSAAVATAAFFVLHVPLLWPVYGTGRVGEYEYLVLYPFVAALASLVGFLFGARMNMCAPVTWLARRAADCSHQAQWTRVAKHALFVAALIVLPALPLELYVSNTMVGGLASLLVAVLVHVVYWAAARCDVSSQREAVARRTAAIWCAVIDVIFLRLAYTIVHMLWADLRFSAWAFYVELIAVGAAFLVALPLLEFCYLRRSECVDECVPTPPCPPPQTCVQPCYAPPPCPPPYVALPAVVGHHGHGRGHGHGHGHAAHHGAHHTLVVVDGVGSEFNGGMTAAELQAVKLQV